MLRLEGPSGVFLYDGWVHALWKGVPRAGIKQSQAVHLEDGGRRWLLQMVFNHWGRTALDEVYAGGIHAGLSH